MAGQDETAKTAAAKAWSCATTQVFAGNVSESFPWVKRHDLFLVRDAGFRTMLVVVTKAGRATAFHEDAGRAANRAELNGLLRAENVSLPEGLPTVELCKSVRAFLTGPAGFVGSATFWDQQQRALKMWTSPTPDKGEELFRQHCQDPVLQRRDKAWTLQFFYFNNRGGVEQWNVAGDAQSIDKCDMKKALPDKTFLFPYG